MPDRSWTFRLRDMLECAEKTEAYVAGLTVEEFCNAPMIVDAVLFNFTILGEAARHVPEDGRKALPGIPWHQINGMRNRIIHAYPSTIASVVRDTIKSDLPPLSQALRQALNDS